MATSLLENEDVCRAWGRAVGDGESDLSTVTGLLKRILREGMWRKREVKGLMKVVEFNRFEEFVTTPPLEGMGTTITLVRNLCRDDPKALDALDQALQRPDGNPHLTVDNVHSCNRPAGNSRDQALRRLRKDAPELHGRVLAGELSAHRAMVQAGFRKESTPVQIVHRAWKRAGKAERKEIVEWINRQG